jgi:hypothetical protein
LDEVGVLLRRVQEEGTTMLDLREGIRRCILTKSMNFDGELEGLAIHLRKG